MGEKEKETKINKIFSQSNSYMRVRMYISSSLYNTLVDKQYPFERPPLVIIFQTRGLKLAAAQKEPLSRPLTVDKAYLH